jgi:F0F1-type ATP synthase assembly protein I
MAKKPPASDSGRGRTDGNGINDGSGRFGAGNEEGAAWSIFGYLISGLVIWGGIGLGLDHWLHTHFIALIGLLLGAGSSLYLVWLRFVRR